MRTRDEIDPSSRGRRGAHRAAPSRLSVLLPVAVVVAVAVAAVLALLLSTGLGDRVMGREVSASAPAATPTAPPTTEPTTPSAPSTPEPDPSDTGDGAPGDQPTGQPDDPSQAPGVDEDGADDGDAPPPGGEGGDARGAPVVVLNATRTSGIAARTAEDLQGQGWTVSRTGDADKGSVDATRVRYSDPALESAAQAVAASLGGAAVELDEGVEPGVVTVVAGPDRVGR